MAIIYRFFLTFIALSLAIAVFLIQQKIHFLPHIHSSLAIFPPVVSYASYLVLCLLFAWLSIKLAKLLDNDTFGPGTIKELEQASDAFLPSYLGYFFVALSTPSFQIFFLVFGIITVLIFFSRAAYFNPLYFLFGYHFYYATTSADVKILVITKKRLKMPGDVKFEKIKRINDFTFIDVEGKK